MASNLSVGKLVEQAYENGKYTYSTFRKVSALAAVAGFWVDLSMATGNPVPNYYVGNELMATVPQIVNGVQTWYKKGLWHGGSVSPDYKFLHKICMFCGTAAAAPAPYILCDYLLYYPLIDMDNTDEQFFINHSDDPEAEELPRYTDGIGVQAFLVATNPYIGGATFYITYTNTNNVSGRISHITTTNTSTNISTIVNSNIRIASVFNTFGAFIALQAGDRGIKSVQSITFQSTNGGLATLVLVKPIANMMTMETTAWAEFDFIKDKPSLPRIYDGAYLNLLVMPSATIAAVPIIGEITTIWGG